jgi:ATP-dependent DNA helicase RecQ
MSDDLTATLRTRFGFAAFRPGQAKAIESLLAGEHALVVMPTGAGKSLIYQLTALLRPGLTLVISPLIALMKDQVDGLSRQRIEAAYINSALPADEQSRRLRALAAGAYRLAYVSPERLRSAAFGEAVGRVSVSLLAVDEAHCISQWGHDFRPDYLQVGTARSLLGEPVTVALTATATPRVQDDIVQLLGLPSARRIVTGFNRPNLTFTVHYALGVEEKLRALRELLAALQGGAAIVYVGTRHDAEEVADFVRCVARVEARYYHAGMEAGERARVQEAFLAGDLPVVVATNAFGMGIDRADVRLVAHYALPGTLEAYYQEAGRAGRDGEPAQAVLLYAPKDRALQEWFIDNDAPAAAEVQALYQALRAPGRPTAWWTSEALSLATGLAEVKVKVGLAQLEAAGSLERLGDAGLRMLLRVGAWDGAAVRAAAASVQERRRHRRAQLEAMVAYAEANGCRRRILLEYFGDRGVAEADACCDNCLAGRSGAVEALAGDAADLMPAQRVGLAILDAVRRLRWEAGRRKLAQLLKGSRARAMRDYAYDTSPYYGRLADFSVREIEDLIGQLIRGRYLKLVGGDLPVLRLTPEGQAALKARSSIPLRLPHPPRPEVVAHKKAEREAGGTYALTAELFARGLSPAEIAAERGLAPDTIYNHLARMIAAGEVTLPEVVPEEVVAQVQAAMAQAGDATCLAPIKALLPENISYGQIRCVAMAWQRREDEAVEADEVVDFMARPHPRPLAGPWRAGWALGFHSRFAGNDWSRSPVGTLAYRLKYEGDQSALQPLTRLAEAVCAEHPELAEVDALVPVPPTAARAFDPVGALAEALGARLSRPVWPVLAKTRRTAPQKEMRTLAQKRANVAGAFAVRGDVRGKALLVLDDLYDSGATLAEVSRTLQRAGAARLCVLTLTRTIHSE